MDHEEYQINIRFTVCEGQREKVLVEMRELLNYIKTSLGHASDHKVTVTHKQV